MAAEVYVEKGGGNANPRNVIRPMVSSRTRAFERSFEGGNLRPAQRAMVAAEARGTRLLNTYSYSADNVRRVARALQNMRGRILPFGWNG